jgi:hypothetical protein
VGLFQVPINRLYCLSRKWGGGGGGGGRAWVFSCRQQTQLVFHSHTNQPLFEPVFRNRIGFNADPDPDPAFYLNADPDPHGSALVRLSGSGFGFGSLMRLDFADHKKLDFDMNN